MKKVAPALGMVALAWACASLTPGGNDVKVYQADVEASETPAPPLPDGCKLVGTTGPIDQQQSDREISDPYLSERNETAALGGNVLYLRSYRFRNLMKLDCPVGDTSPGCMDRSQSWYKVTFYSYACEAAALNALEAAPQPSTPAVFRVDFKKKTPKPTPPLAAQAPVAATPAPSAAPAAPAAPARAALLKSQVLALMQEGVGTDVIVSYVRANRPAPPLTAEEIIDWKKAGISDAIIDATFAK